MKVTNKELKYSQLQINFEDSMQEDNAEHESNAGVYASLKITENNITNGFVVKDRLLEKIMDKENVRVALKRVISNKGSHGIDEMKVDELRAYRKRKLDYFETISYGWEIPSQSRSESRNTERRRDKEKKARNTNYSR